MTDLAAPPRHLLPSNPVLSTIAAGIVVAGPVLTLVSELIAPREPEGLSPTEGMSFLLDNGDRLTASWLVGMVAAVCLATGYVLLGRLFTRRGRVVGRIAAGLGVLGAFGLAGHYAMSLAALDIAKEDSSATAVVKALEDGLGAIVTVAPTVLGLNLAIILIAVAAARAGWAPWWLVGAGVLALVADFSPTNYNTVLHAVFATVVLGVIAASLTRRHQADAG